MDERNGGSPVRQSVDGVAGRTVIGDPAAVKIAAIAARSVPGVHALGAGTGRALGAIRDAVGGSDLGQGVRVEVGQSQVAVDISLVADYGYPLNRLADSVRTAVCQAVEELVGLDVIEVNVEIADVHIPGLNDTRSNEIRGADKGRSPGASARTPIE
ncbi:putative alkaline shock family protein YloU [Arthrobacter sp. CAN_A214]|uniref:Asp23/Gls24 family envelope stress response protein n=1 Tax=Arthrobacter sp. CAN_A214 TaxID=2787720 RepID=UPI0018CA54DC